MEPDTSFLSRLGRHYFKFDLMTSLADSNSESYELPSLRAVAAELTLEPQESEF